MKIKDIPLEKLRSLFSYDSETGALTRLRTVAVNAVKGALAGSVNDSGYLLVKISGKNVAAHHIAWALHTGAWAENLLDHVNGNRADNRFANLRECDRSENARNRSKNRVSKSGFKGVTRHKRSSGWNAEIRASGKKLYLGTFDSPELAYAAYVAAAEKYFGDFARGS